MSGSLSIIFNSHRAGESSSPLGEGLDQQWCWRARPVWPNTIFTEEIVRSELAAKMMILKKIGKRATDGKIGVVSMKSLVEGSAKKTADFIFASHKLGESDCFIEKNDGVDHIVGQMKKNPAIRRFHVVCILNVQREKTTEKLCARKKKKYLLRKIERFI